MLKRSLALVLAVVLVGLAGCRNMEEQLRKQNATLSKQLALCQDERDALLKSIDELDAEQQQLRAQLLETREDAQSKDELVRRLRQEQAQLEQQRRELQKLVEGLSGISVETRGEGNFIVLENEILFELGKVELNQDAKASLDKVASYLQRRPDVAVRIDGHTDGVPVRHSPWKDNYHLSAMRAHAVMQYLVQKGLDPDRVYIVGFGPNRPRTEPAEPAEPVAENRRVEILLVPEGVKSIGEILQGFEE
ncbi:MAG: OmpA family protein [Candidatus Brocadiaceae bacterium]|jgi:chemotaxis protein MotB